MSLKQCKLLKHLSGLDPFNHQQQSQPYLLPPRQDIDFLIKGQNVFKTVQISQTLERLEPFNHQQLFQPYSFSSRLLLIKRKDKMFIKQCKFHK